MMKPSWFVPKFEAPGAGGGGYERPNHGAILLAVTALTGIALARNSNIPEFP
jgi:hypothetical protein